jgi:putative methionine-R-sulfoxide reductase with GAF domain
VIAWSGLGPPAFMRFAANAGLTGEAVRSKATVVVNDVSTNPHYLTAFAGTAAEIIVPVLDPTGQSRGRLDRRRERQAQRIRRSRSEGSRGLRSCARATLE